MLMLMVGWNAKSGMQKIAVKKYVVLIKKSILALL